MFINSMLKFLLVWNAVNHLGRMILGKIVWHLWDAAEPEVNKENLLTNSNLLFKF